MTSQKWDVMVLLSAKVNCLNRLQIKWLSFHSTYMLKHLKIHSEASYLPKTESLTSAAGRLSIQCSGAGSMVLRCELWLTFKCDTHCGCLSHWQRCSSLDGRFDMTDRQSPRYNIIISVRDRAYSRSFVNYHWRV